jgi:hypothetical protein
LREVAIEPLSLASERAALFGAGARIPDGFDAWFSQCVSRSIDKRFSTARAAFAALEPILAAAAAQGETTLADRLRSLPQVSTPTPASQTTPERPVQQTLPMTISRPRRRALLWTTVTAVSAFLAVGVVVLVTHRSDEVRAPESTATRAAGEKTLLPLGPVNQGEPQPTTTAIAPASTAVPGAATVSKPKLGLPDATPPGIELKLPPWPPLGTLTTGTTTGTEPPPIGTAPPPGSGTAPPPLSTTDPPKKFDAGAAKSSLQAVAYKDCGKGGPGTVSVVFAPKGHAQSAFVTSGSYSDATKVCVGQRFAKAKVPPFEGAPQPVVMSIELPNE